MPHQVPLDRQDLGPGPSQDLGLDPLDLGPDPLDLLPAYPMYPEHHLQ